MTFHFYFAPFLTQNALLIDEEGAALDAEIFFAVELLKLNNTKELAESFFRITDQFKGKTMFGLKAFMDVQTVFRDAKNGSITGVKIVFASRNSCPSVVQPGVLSRG